MGTGSFATNKISHQYLGVKKFHEFHICTGRFVQVYDRELEIFKTVDQYVRGRGIEI